MSNPAGTSGDVGEATRERILSAAAELVLHRGFAGTSLDVLLKKVGITKGAFFYHFKSKAELGRALIRRHAVYEEELLNHLLRRAENLSKDPLQQVLLAVGLLEEKIIAQGGPPEGCLYATYAYETEQFEPDVRKIIADALVLWRNEFAARLRQAVVQRPPKIAIDADELADIFSTILEGAFIMARVMDDRGIFIRHMRHYRNYLELIFDQTSPVGAVESTQEAVQVQR